jgi:N-methylhydantoinase A/oxoprolinase/acetone carboxylase beta subunit
MEERAEYIVRNTIPDARVTLSSAIGRLSLLERENATIMNASLAGLAEKTIGAFGAALCSLGVGCELYISQNDGTLMSADFAKQYPVLTFSSGPTNSIRGAAYLSKLDTALVADVGGTTTDVGILSRGFPRESSLATDIGGVRTNFRMPDIISLGIGGGSIVRVSGTACTVGPRSVGYRLTSDAMVFGGNTMTATDVAVAAGYADLGDSSLVKQIPRATVSAAVEKIHASVADTVDRMKTSNELLPMIIVGGGSILINRDIEGVSETVIPHWSEVANAVGASLAQVGGEVDRVYNYDDGGRAAAIEHATEEATDMAVRAGADKQQVTVIDFEEVPMAYMPGNAVRIRLRTAGPLAQSESEDRALD